MRHADLPAWVFHETNVGCGVPQHPDDCLCDVHVTSNAPVTPEAGMLFGALALQTVGELDETTFYQFAETLFGCYEMYRDGIVEWIPADDPDVLGSEAVVDNRPRREAHEKSIGSGHKVLGQMSPATVWTFRHGWTWGIPWSKIKRCVPPEMVSRKFGKKTLGRVYSERLYHPKTRGAR